MFSTCKKIATIQLLVAVSLHIISVNDLDTRQHISWANQPSFDQYRQDNAFQGPMQSLNPVLKATLPVCEDRF